MRALSRDKALKFSLAVEAQALDMHLNNVGIRKIARFVGASPAVLKWIRPATSAWAPISPHKCLEVAPAGRP